MRLLAALLTALLAVPGALSFQHVATKTPSRVVLASSDPTKVWYAEVANGLQKVLTNSPLNEGKKMLVKALAGPYDEVATKAKLEAYTKEPVVMLSFTS